jgi:sigma-54 dependent transcriptional regulator, acetoin dehydrogenase operon transcriptional activator AcoR
VRLHFHSRPEFIGTLFEGLISFSQGGRFLAANRGALFQLGLDLNSLQRHTLSSLFGISMDELMDHCRSATPQLLTSSLPNGVTVRVRADMQVMKLWQVPADANGNTIAPPQESAQQAHNLASQRREHMSSLRYLDTGDPQISAVIQKLRRIQGHEIPIMVFGETGVGKELLAKAVHNDSPRARNPFIAVNCASIPESLIESELFGYEEGAFTGARRKGAMGKIQMANGGTLFLDEIGDMPLSLQTRLLRALQERVITPLGSNRSIPVNFAVISATHRNLRQMVSSGQFREDLYYRLNGLAVRIPALRERTDLETITNHILLTGTEVGGGKKLSEEVRKLFEVYPWPGNVRQLTNVLRTASVLAGHDPLIQIDHLPDDFLEEMRVTHSTQAVDASAPSTSACEPAQASASPVSAPASSPLSWGGKGLQEVEIEAIHHALNRCNGNVSQAARMLGVSRNTIYRKVPELAQKKD